MNLNPTEYGAYTHPDDPGEPLTHAPRISVTNKEAALLAFLASGKRVLEIGTGLGVSTDAMAKTAFRLTTVDNDPWVWDNVWPHYKQPATFVHVETAISTVGIGPVPPFDFCFIDGHHSKEATVTDLHEAIRLVDRGVIAVHDTFMPDVVEGINSVVGETWHNVGTHHGIGIVFRGWAE